eukprot:3346428-Amphidinium_carterae.1
MAWLFSFVVVQRLVGFMTNMKINATQKKKDVQIEIDRMNKNGKAWGIKMQQCLPAAVMREADDCILAA